MTVSACRLPSLAQGIVLVLVGVVDRERKKKYPYGRWTGDALHLEAYVAETDGLPK